MITTTSKYLIIIFFILYPIITKSELIINEIMPVPIDGEPEWIELFNNSTNIELYSNLTISDATTSRKISPFSSFPGEYVILVKDTNLFRTFRQLPDKVKLIQISIPTLNNTTDLLTLKDSNGVVLDSVYYDMKWGEKGISLERIDFLIPAQSKENWSKSLVKSGATPGEINSSIKLQYDLECSDISLDNGFENVITSIINIGKSKIDHFSYKMFVDSILIEERDDVFINDIDVEIKISLDYVKSKIKSNGTYQFTSIISSELDKNYRNDTITADIYIRKENPIIRINEIMYDVSDTVAEFIELWNGGEDTLLIDNFLIWDAAGSISKGNIQIVSANFKIPPKEYGIICWDSIFFKNYPELINKNNVYYYKSSFNLNLNNDLIVFADVNGKIYDSLTYSNKWHNNIVKDTKNRSLEKINFDLNSSLATSWSTCSDIKGGTPLKLNSISLISEHKSKISIYPNPFSPNSLGNDQTTVINYQFPFKSGFVNAVIYDANAYEIFKISNNLYSSSNSAFVWDGKNKDGYVVQSGQYILIIEFTDSDSGEVIIEKELIIVGN